MKIKEYILIFRQIRGSKGCIVISDLSKDCKIATVYGNYTMDDLEFEQDSNQFNIEEGKLKHLETIKQQAAIAAIRGYVARDKDGNVFLFKNKPYKDSIAWKEDSDEFILYMDSNNLPSDINPQWGDEKPIEVNINITKASDDVVTILKDRYEQLLQCEQRYKQRQSPSHKIVIKRKD